MLYIHEWQQEVQEPGIYSAVIESIAGGASKANYMGLVFERVCKEYLLWENSAGRLPLLFTNIGRWWGTDPVSRQQEEVDLVASDGTQYLIGECKWRNERVELSVLEELKRRARIIQKNDGKSWYVLFSKEGFSETLIEETKKDERILLVDIDRLTGCGGKSGA